MQLDLGLVRAAPKSAKTAKTNQLDLGLVRAAPKSARIAK